MACDAAGMLTSYQYDGWNHNWAQTEMSAQLTGAACRRTSPWCGRPLWTAPTPGASRGAGCRGPLVPCFGGVRCYEGVIGRA